MYPDYCLLIPLLVGAASVVTVVVAMCSAAQGGREVRESTIPTQVTSSVHQGTTWDRKEKGRPAW